MDINRQQPNVDWTIAEADGTVPSWERAGIAVLMDIRRELRRLNRLLACPNFTSIPNTLRQIRRNTTRKTRKK